MAIIICSGDAEFIQRCRNLLVSAQELEVCGKVDRLKNSPPAADDLLIVDLSGCQEKDLFAVSTPSAALATIPTYEQAVRLLQLGYRAYGNRHMNRANFMQAIAAVYGGQVWLPPSILHRMIATFAHTQENESRERPFLEQLSTREREVAQWVAKGMANKEIADSMKITVRTVKAHMTSILSKTGIRDRLELALKMSRA